MPKTKRDRDVQRVRVYRAEDAAGMREAGVLKTFNGVRAFCLRVLADPRVAAKYPRTAGAAERVAVTEGQPGAYAWAAHDKVVLPPWAWSKGVILHELAHCVHDQTPQHWAEAAHGWRFCGIFLDLVEWFLGPVQAARLRLWFDVYKVVWATPPEPPQADF